MISIYFVSLYYDNSVVTGANNRFDEIGRRLHVDPRIDLKVIVSGKNIPRWCSEEACVSAPSFNSRIGRIWAFLWLSWYFLRVGRGIVVSDFMPIPLFLRFGRHNHYQLIHDLRNFGVFARGGLGRLTSLFQKFQLRYSHNVLTVSEFSAHEIEMYCGIDKENICVSYNGINIDQFACPDSGDREVDILYVATFEARKNHENLVAALEAFEQDLNVVFVGRDLGLRAKIEGLAQESKQNIKFIDSLPCADLTALYRSAKVFVFPSFYEGFGMPLVEAMEHGCSLACSNLPVFQEIAGENAIYFDAHDPSSIAAAIKILLIESEQAQLQRRIKLKQQASKFDWEFIYSELLYSLGIN